MASEAEVVPATLMHSVELGDTMRPADVLELEAAGFEPHQALVYSLSRSAVACSLMLEGKVGAMFGVCPHHVGGVAAGVEMGQFWFLTAHLFGRHPRPFLRAARRVVKALLLRYPVLFNAIDARYTGALRLAESFGAEFGSPSALGPLGLPFVPFRIRRA